MDFVRSFIALVLGSMTVYGGCYFFLLTVHDLFCSIGNEYLFVSDRWVKGMKNLRWNRKK